MAWNDFIGLSPQGSSVRSECVGGRRRARWRNVRSEREREGRAKEREERKEGRKEERKKGGKKEKFVRARVPCGHPWGFHSTGGSTRPLIPSFIHAARDLNR